ncbi:MAG: cysteine desulfurase family protein [Rubricoccaceae bacterium]|nr:cysteine desulfurase family protein [Rubricoccaceae bacterium]
MLYLDHAATTPLDPAVLEAMRPYLTEHYGNASSVHALGRRARVAVEEARGRVADVLGCAPAEVVFTSGGTEGDNAALRGVLTGPALAQTGRPGLVTSAAEHEAVRQTAEALDDEGHPVAILRPGRHGALTPAQVDAALDASTGLVSVMRVNNEIGTVSPVAAIAERAHAAGALVHTDAVQAVGLLPLDVEALGVDLLSLSGHKVYGPKGIGALFVRAGTPFSPLLRGGSQERRRRGGTENVAAIVGLAEALVQAEERRGAEAARLARLQRRLAERLRASFGEGVVFNTPLDGVHPDPHPVAPHILSVSFPPQEGAAVDGEMLLLALDMAGVCVSSGSACASGAIEPSHVLLALGAERATAAATIRFSLGRSTDPAAVDKAADHLDAVVRRLRGL